MANKIGKSGYKGVHRTRAIVERYEAYIVLYNNDYTKRVKRYLGSFDTPEQAYIARIKFIDSLK